MTGLIILFILLYLINKATWFYSPDILSKAIINTPINKWPKISALVLILILIMARISALYTVWNVGGSLW